MIFSIKKTSTLFIGAWIAVAIGVLIFNRLTLLTVLDHPAPSFSNNVVRVKQMSRQLDQVVASSQKLLADTEDLDLNKIFSRYCPMLYQRVVPEPIRELIRPTMKTGERKGAKTFSLPRVTGIFHSSDGNGHNNTTAIIDGEYLRKNEKIKGYTIIDISPEGVVLAKGGSTWFVPAPKGRYSVTHADGA